MPMRDNLSRAPGTSDEGSMIPKDVLNCLLHALKLFSMICVCLGGHFA